MPPSSLADRGRSIGAAVAVAVVVNLVVYAVGRLAGGEFTFTQGDSEITVAAVTVAGFSAVPLGLGLVLVALLVGRVPRIASVTSTVTLAACHLTLVPISLVAIQRLRGAR